LHNPLISDDKKKVLVDPLSCHDIPLIEDDVYGDLSFSRHRSRVAKAFDRKVSSWSAIHLYRSAHDEGISSSPGSIF
jgi:DNA-binding transcriptional MocR family regulator